METEGGIYAVTTEPAALNSYVVIGSERALIVDTGSGPRQAQRILSAARALTELPLAVVNTHDHWDHFFGNAHMRACGVDEFLAAEPFARDQLASAWLQLGEVPRDAEPELPQDPAELIVAPTRTLSTGDVIDLGGTAVEVIECCGHTHCDLVLRIGDVLIVGDLVEEGAPPQFGDDALPTAWARTLGQLLGLEGVNVFCPGHGQPVNRAFVREQAQAIAVIAEQLSDPGAAPGEPPTLTAEPFGYVPTALPTGPHVRRIR